MSKIEWVERGPFGLTPEHVGKVVGLGFGNGVTHWGELVLLQEGENTDRVYKLRGRDDWGYSPEEPKNPVTKVFVRDTEEKK